MAHNQSDIAIVVDILKRKLGAVIEKEKFNDNPAPRDMKWFKGVLIITPKTPLK